MLKTDGKQFSNAVRKMQCLNGKKDVSKVIIQLWAENNWLDITSSCYGPHATMKFSMTCECNGLYIAFTMKDLFPELEGELTIEDGTKSDLYFRHSAGYFVVSDTLPVGSVHVDNPPEDAKKALLNAADFKNLLNSIKSSESKEKNNSLSDSALLKMGINSYELAASESHKLSFGKLNAESNSEWKVTIPISVSLLACDLMGDYLEIFYEAKPDRTCVWFSSSSFKMFFTESLQSNPLKNAYEQVISGCDTERLIAQLNVGEFLTSMKKYIELNKSEKFTDVTGVKELPIVFSSGDSLLKTGSLNGEINLNVEAKIFDDFVFKINALYVMDFLKSFRKSSTVGIRLSEEGKIFFISDYVCHVTFTLNDRISN